MIPYGGARVCPIIGIDLGTTNSCVAVYRDLKHANRKVDIAPNTFNGMSITPSVVYFPSIKGTPVVGEAAREMMAEEPESVAFDVKRLFGKKMEDSAVAKVRDSGQRIVDDGHGRPRVLIRPPECDQPLELYPHEVSTIVLKRLREFGERALNSNRDVPVTVTKAVVCVPAHFTTIQREETVEAARKAGIEATLMTEPAAAAYAYGYWHERFDNYKLLVFDLGGGTFDVSVVTVSNGEFTVVGLGGDTELGGRDFDDELKKYCLREAQRIGGCEWHLSDADNQLLLRKCEDAKKNLSEQQSAQVRLSGFRRLPSSLVGQNITITRPVFDELVRSLVNRAMNRVGTALRESGVEKGDIDEIILAGGGTRVPLVQSELKIFFGGDAKLNNSINGDEVVAIGAAVRAAQMCPDVKMPNMRIRDMVALSLGVYTHKGVFSTVIPRRSNLPTTETLNYVTVANNQTGMSFGIYEGERRMVKDNYFLGRVAIDGLPAAKVGTVSVKMTMALDEEGRLTVRVVHEPTMRRETITLDYQTLAANGASIEDMLEKARIHKDADNANEARALALSLFEIDIEKAEWGISPNLSSRSLKEAVRASLCEEARAWINANERSVSLMMLKAKNAAFRNDLEKCK